MPIKQHIIVTQDDIDHGKRGQCSLCPIARAVMRIMDAGRVSVCGDVEVVKDGQKSIWWPPDEAHTFIAMFDNGDKVYPIEFDMTLDEDQINA